jgi:fatty acid desaturase
VVVWAVVPSVAAATAVIAPLAPMLAVVVMMLAVVVMMLAVVLPMVTGGIVSPVAGLADAHSADRQRSGRSNECDKA